MKNQDIIKYALINSLTTTLYIILIASFMFIGSQNFFPKTDTIFAPIAMLMLFVFSAALTGSLVLGRPILWYLEGKKKEAVKLFIYTLGVFFIITIIIFSIILIA